MKHLFIFILTTLTFSFALEAANVPGYIIKNSSDTVWGEIKVSPFSRIKGSFNLNGPETGSFYFGVVFRENSDSDFATYYPASLQGFSFQYKSAQYHFSRFTLNYKSIVVSEKKRDQFLCLLYRDTNYELYRNVIVDPNNGLMSVPDQWLQYTIYYLFSPAKGIVKVEKSRQYKNLGALLTAYDFEAQFVAQLDKSTDFVDIMDVLKQYSSWLKINKKQ